MKSKQQLTSVFNIPQIEEDSEIDYRKLYEKEKKMRQFFQKKTRDLQSKLKTYLRDNHRQFGKNKRNDIHEIMEDIKSFKSLMPNSVKEIAPLSSDSSIDGETIPPLIKQWAIYGLNEQLLTNASQPCNTAAGLIASSSKPSQYVEHSSRMAFPFGTSFRKLGEKTAQECSLDIINLSKKKLKTFILTFQPTSIQRNEQKDGQNSLEIIDILNPDRRVFAICMELDEFTILHQNNQEIQLKTPKKSTHKSVKFVNIPSNRSTDQLQIAVSKRIYCIFSYYPFFGFFQQLLKSLLSAVKVERYIRYKEGGENLRLVDSRFHGNFMKNALEELKKQSINKNLVFDKLLDFSVCGNNKAYLQLNRDSLAFNLAEEWAYYVLSLFTLDVFLDLLTFMMLEEKIVFVCTNATILTHAVYLFTSVLIRPFKYPFPTASLIHDQEYFDSPFPAVYGFMKSRNQVIEAKIPKRFKNVFVFMESTGVQLYCQQDKKKVLAKRSPRLRDRLISKFKKMRRNYPSLPFFSFINKKTQEFEYPVNIELAREVLGEVYNYIQKEIYRILPSEAAVEKIKEQLMAAKQIEEQDLNHEIFLKVKEEYSCKSKDPFFAAFLETQLFSIHLFKY